LQSLAYLSNILEYSISVLYNYEAALDNILSLMNMMKHHIVTFNF